jgi:hypothetical protein
VRGGDFVCVCVGGGGWGLLRHDNSSLSFDFATCSYSCPFSHHDVRTQKTSTPPPHSQVSEKTQSCSILPSHYYSYLVSLPSRLSSQPRATVIQSRGCNWSRGRGSTHSRHAKAAVCSYVTKYTCIREVASQRQEGCSSKQCQPPCSCVISATDVVRRQGLKPNTIKVCRIVVFVGLHSWSEHAQS